MITEKQLAANRRNALKSTGLRTVEGKNASKMNAVKYGLTSRQVLMPGEDSEDFFNLRGTLFKEFEPVGFLETKLVDELAGLYYRLTRICRIEAEILVHARNEARRDLAKARKMAARTRTLESRPSKDIDSGVSADSERFSERERQLEEDLEASADSLGAAFMHDARIGDSLSKLGRHEARTRNAITRTVQELAVLQELRRYDEPFGEARVVGEQLSSPDSADTA